MTPLQREALQMCLEYIKTDAHERRHVRWKINEALAEPQPEPVLLNGLTEAETNSTASVVGLTLSHAPCLGMDCGITRTDQIHSAECQAEHAAAIAGGKFVKPAQPQQEPVAWMHEWEDGEKIPMLKGRDDRNQDKPKTVRPLVYGDTSPQPAQPQQEPVACGGEQEAPYIGHDCNPALPDSMKVFCPACCTKFRAIPAGVQKLMLDAGFEPPFTSPPAQEFVCSTGLCRYRKPLTDEEIESMWIGSVGFLNRMLNQHTRLAFARAIEAAHGIKEQP